jgi:hypothetical protein
MPSPHARIPAFSMRLSRSERRQRMPSGDVCFPRFGALEAAFGSNPVCSRYSWPARVSPPLPTRSRNGVRVSQRRLASRLLTVSRLAWQNQSCERSAMEAAPGGARKPFCSQGSRPRFPVNWSILARQPPLGRVWSLLRNHRTCPQDLSPKVLGWARCKPAGREQRGDNLLGPGDYRPTRARTRGSRRA